MLGNNALPSKFERIPLAVVDTAEYSMMESKLEMVLAIT
jgi:hypothetical protein